MAKTKKIKMNELKKGQFFRRGKKRVIWMKDNSIDYIVQITGKTPGLIVDNFYVTNELVTPINVKIQEIKD